MAASLVYNLTEFGVAVWAGVVNRSIALVGFGLDSLIESSASALVLWRLRLETGGGPSPRVRRAEHVVHRFVGWTFFALALYVAADAVRTLLLRQAPGESPVGIGLAMVSLLLMPGLSLWKLRVAGRLKSAALRAEARETLACSWLSLTLLAGLSLNALWGWWWADPVAALLMVPWLVKEGIENIRGEDCADCR